MCLLELFGVCVLVYLYSTPIEVRGELKEFAFSFIQISEFWGLN